MVVGSFNRSVNSVHPPCNFSISELSYVCIHTDIAVSPHIPQSQLVCPPKGWKNQAKHLVSNINLSVLSRFIANPRHTFYICSNKLAKDWN